MLNAVIFDLDETILDRGFSLRSFVKWQAEGMLQNSVSDQELFCKRFVELDANGSVWKDKVYAQLVDEFGIDDWSVNELLRSYELCFCGFAQPKEGALNAIKELHSIGIKLGLVSNGKSPFQERNFNALGVSSIFDSVIISEAVGSRKPEAEIFDLSLKQLGVEPSEAAFVGDNPSVDIDGAKMAGMFTVYIPGYYGKTYENADKVCNDFSELPNIIKKTT